MAHKTLIGGTTYEIKGGRTLVNGTGYDIKAGRTLVGGTGYDVEFFNGVAVTITGTGATTKCYVIISGTTYAEAASLEVEPGAVIQCFYRGQTVTMAGATQTVGGLVTVDGTVKASSTTTSGTYNWTVPSGISAISITLEAHSIFNAGSVTITTS